jgi:hypothetical protein
VPDASAPRSGAGLRAEVAEPAPLSASVVRASGTVEEPAAPRADAGDDQIGLVDRQITLNGSKSRPEGGLGFRWIQVSGPQAVAMAQDGPFLTFTTRQAGVYRFALVVASGSRISEPDMAEVTVGLYPPGVANEPRPQVPAPAVSPPQSIEDLTRGLLATVPGGPDVAESLAGHLDAVAGRVDLYGSYGELFAELSRRLDGSLPADAALRSAWDQRFFLPLSARLVEQLREEGLDLARPDGASRPFTPAQRQRLGAQLRSIAVGARAAGAASKS